MIPASCGSPGREPRNPARDVGPQPGLAGPAVEALRFPDEDAEHAPRHCVMLVQPVEAHARLDQSGDDLAERVNPGMGYGILECCLPDAM